MNFSQEDILALLPFQLDAEEIVLFNQILATVPKFANLIFFAFVYGKDENTAYANFTNMKTIFTATPVEVMGNQVLLDFVDAEPFASIFIIQDSTYQAHVVSTLGQESLDQRLALYDTFYV